MPGFMVTVGRCYACRRIFEFNAESVPSITPQGKEYRDREPVCGICMAAINAKRTEAGLPALPVRADAYEAQEV